MVLSMEVGRGVAVLCVANIGGSIIVSSVAAISAHPPPKNNGIAPP